MYNIDKDLYHSFLHARVASLLGINLSKRADNSQMICRRFGKHEPELIDIDT